MKQLCSSRTVETMNWSCHGGGLAVKDTAGFSEEHGSADYFLSFISLSKYLLACKEQKARQFSIHMYVCLFQEFGDTYSRQEVLGSLVTHVGSSVGFEVSSALETMSLLVSKYAQQGYIAPSLSSRYLFVFPLICLKSHSSLTQSVILQLLYIRVSRAPKISGSIKCLTLWVSKKDGNLGLFKLT